MTTDQGALVCSFFVRECFDAGPGFFKCCLQDVVFLRITRSSDLSCSLNLSYTKQKSMENYAVRLSSTVCDSSTTIADTVRCIALECVIL